MTKSVHSPLIFAWFGLVLIASVGLYRTSDRVQHLDFQLRQLNATIESEQQRMHVLKAEWTYLSNPARLAAAAHKHLALRPTALQQITSLDQAANLIPERGSVAAAPAPTAKLATKTASVSARVSARIAAAKISKTSSVASTVAVPAAARPEPTKVEATSQAAERAADQTDSVPAKTASAQPLPDSIGALLDRMDAHP